MSTHTIGILALCLLAGFMVGSFALPVKYMERWKEENVWFLFPIIAFLVLPWLTIMVFVPHWALLISNLPGSIFAGMIFGGLMFGCGMFFFSLAFGYIGIGINFVINISIGTAGGALVPILWHPDEIGSLYSILQIVGVVIFILAVIYSSVAGACRDENIAKSNDSGKQGLRRNLLIGILFSVLAGIGSAFQGASYGVANGTIVHIAQGLNIFEIPASLIGWGFIFGFSAFPYSIFFLIKMFKNKSFKNYSSGKFMPYFLTVVVMSALYWGGLVFFSIASVEVGSDLATTIAWPLFMVFIILSSIFWSLVSGEWKNAGKKAFNRLLVCIALFCIAIVVFAYNSTLQQQQVTKPSTTQQS